MNTYIGKNKFQFITDFSKHAAFDTDGKEVILDFNTLTIYERIMLSSYLTILCDSSDNNDTKLENIYNKIFNFNSVKKYVKTSYHDAFLTDLTLFLKRAPLFFAFIKTNFDKIENDHTFIFRQQLNATEMDLLYSLKFQKSYKSLMNVLYIIGVAKQNIRTSALNKIPLNAFYSTSPYLSKKRVEEIFDKINSVSKYQVQYKIYKNIIYFGNGFEIEENEQFYSEDKKNVLEQLKVDEILNGFNTPINEQPIIKEEPIKQEIKKEEVKETPIIEDSIIEEEQDELLSVKELLQKLHKHLKDGNRINETYLDNFYNALKIEGPIYLTKIKDETFSEGQRSKILQKIYPTIIDPSTYIKTKCNNLTKLVIKKEHVDNYGEVADAARNEQKAFKSYICNCLNKIYNLFEEQEPNNLEKIFNVVLAWILISLEDTKKLINTNI